MNANQKAKAALNVALKMGWEARLKDDNTLRIYHTGESLTPRRVTVRLFRSGAPDAKVSETEKVDGRIAYTLTYQNDPPLAVQALARFVGWLDAIDERLPRLRLPVGNQLHLEVKVGTHQFSEDDGPLTERNFSLWLGLNHIEFTTGLGHTRLTVRFMVPFIRKVTGAGWYSRREGQGRGVTVVRSLEINGHKWTWERPFDWLRDEYGPWTIREDGD